jgi:hypothetical protein
LCGKWGIHAQFGQTSPDGEASTAVENSTNARGAYY